MFQTVVVGEVGGQNDPSGSQVVGVMEEPANEFQSHEIIIALGIEEHGIGTAGLELERDDLAAERKKQFICENCENCELLFMAAETNCEKIWRCVVVLLYLGASFFAVEREGQEASLLTVQTHTDVGVGRGGRREGRGRGRREGRGHRDRCRTAAIECHALQ